MAEARDYWEDAEDTFTLTRVCCPTSKRNYFIIIIIIFFFGVEVPLRMVQAHNNVHYTIQTHLIGSIQCLSINEFSELTINLLHTPAHPRHMHPFSFSLTSIVVKTLHYVAALYARNDLKATLKWCVSVWCLSQQENKHVIILCVDMLFYRRIWIKWRNLFKMFCHLVW